MDKVEVKIEEGLSNTPGDNPKPTSEVPENFPEKFVTDGKPDYEKLAKSYVELERHLGTATGKPDAKTEQFDNPDAGKEGDERSQPGESQGETILPGVDNNRIEEISQHAWENRELSPEHYDELAKAGYSKDIVDQYMAGQFAVAEGQHNSLINAGGGQEAVEAMFNWAAESLDQATVDSYNAKFDAGGPDALMAMENLKSKYESSGVALPSGGRVTGANAAGGPSDVYTSAAQVQEAMADARYKSDPAYRKAVADKIGRSNVL
jgi:hypothetical protein